MPYKTILFDLDGTIVDQFSAIHKSVNHVQDEIGLQLSDFNTVKSAVGGSLELTLKRLFKGFSLEKTLPMFKSHFENIMFDEVILLPHVESFLEASKKEGIQMAVLTNKIGRHARSTLKHLKIEKYFDIVLGVEDTKYKKPDARFTYYILKKLNKRIDECCLIGDSPFDWETGKNVNMDVFLVATGTHDILELKQLTNSPKIYTDIKSLSQYEFNLNLKNE